MASYNVLLNDEVNRTYERKNKYLLELAELEERLESIDNKEERKKIKESINNHKKNKNKHPYIIEYNNYKEKEKFFLKELKNLKTKKKNSLKDEKYKDIINYKIREYSCDQKINFYKNYINLSYDAKYYYNKAKVTKTHVKDIIDSLYESYDKLEKSNHKINNIDKNLEEKKKKELKEFKLKEKENIKAEDKKLYKSYKSRLISKKAYENSKKIIKRKSEHRIEVKKREIPSIEIKDIIKNQKYNLTKGIKLKEKALSGDLSDIRRTIPIEKEKTNNSISYLTLFFPGLGQILNRQYVKGALYLIASLFIYLIAIPYALGYGNYQGDGIFGLISLADGAPRVHRSLIFMIEGVLAILLLIIAFFLIYISFKDVKSVEKDIVKGIRPRNWFETKRGIEEDGFPYLVTMPALLVTIFIVLVPIITTVLLSFTNMNPSNQSRFNWVGLDNYRRILLGEGLAGSVFWYVFLWTIAWTILATTLAIVIGFVLALLCNNPRVKGKKIFRTIYLLPWAVPAFITILFFSIMFSTNGALTTIISDLFGGGERIVVKDSANLTRLTLILLQGWLGSSYIFLLSTGVLQAIPDDLYEASDIDGATSWQKISKITLPIVLFQTAPLLVTQYTFNFNNFSIIYLFNQGGPFMPSRYGNLAGSSDILISYIYKLTMENQQQAIGAAIIMFVSIGLMFFAFLGFKNSKAFKEEKL